MEWQLPVSDDLLRGSGYRIHENSKIHCFNNDGRALCSRKIYMISGYWETTDYGANDIDKYPEYFCKKCVKKI